MHKHSRPATELSVIKGGTGKWKVLENDGHVSGNGGAGYPSSSCFGQLHCLFNLCIPQCPYLEANTDFLYLHSLECVFFSPPLIRDDGILEPFIIKRHNRSINFASVGLILAYTIKL